MSVTVEKHAVNYVTAVSSCESPALKTNQLCLNIVCSHCFIACKIDTLAYL